jgi:hypothetical protein
VKLIQKHLSVANVLSCLALFVALSATAVAASNLGNKSVKTKNLANSVVTTAKLRNLAVTAAKLGEGSVTSGKLASGAVRSSALGGGVVTEAKLKNGAVTGAKLAGNSVDTAKIGAGAVVTGHIQEGAVTGAKLAPSLLGQLVKNVSYVTATSASGPSPNLKTVTAECIPSATRKQVVGGGARVLGANTKVALIESAPKLDAAGNRVGWTASANEFDEELGDWSIEAYAICAEF